MKVCVQQLILLLQNTKHNVGLCCLSPLSTIFQLYRGISNGGVSLPRIKLW